jgi:hypothetical protein
MPTTRSSGFKTPENIPSNSGSVRRKGEVPQAGVRHWSFQGAEEGQKSSREEILTK